MYPITFVDISNNQQNLFNVLNFLSEVNVYTKFNLTL